MSSRSLLPCLIFLNLLLDCVLQHLVEIGALRTIHVHISVFRLGGAAYLRSSIMQLVPRIQTELALTFCDK